MIIKQVPVDGYGITTISIPYLGVPRNKYECRWIDTVQVVSGKRTYYQNKLGIRRFCWAVDLQTALEYMTNKYGRRPNSIKRV